MYHDGELEVDWDAWPDRDEQCHGPIDTKTHRREIPEGFTWSCCGKNGTFAEGCCRVEKNSDDDDDDDKMIDEGVTFQNDCIQNVPYLKVVKYVRYDIRAP